MQGSQCLRIKTKSPFGSGKATWVSLRNYLPAFSFSLKHPKFRIEIEMHDLLSHKVKYYQRMGFPILKLKCHLGL